MNLFLKPFRTLLILLVITGSFQSVVADPITTDIVEISMNTGYYQFDDDWGLESAEFLGWGLGLQFTKSFRLILNYSRIDPSDSEDQGDFAGYGDLKVQRYNGDFSYSFFNESPVRPYLAFSYGEIDITYREDGEKEQKQDEQLSYGGGVLFKLHPKWFLRLDLREVDNHRRGHKDINSMLSIAYRFGQGEQ